METRASYFFVGLFVLALLAGAFGFGLWAARGSLQDDSTYYYVYFRGSVTGLQNGSQVQLRGVPVGTVTDISIDEGNIEQIQVTLSIKPRTPIKTDTVAQLQFQGITGLSFILLSGGTTAAPMLEPREGKRRATIQSVPSPLEKVFENAPEVMAQVMALASRANQLLDDKNIQAITGILENLDRTLATVAESRGDLGGMMRNGSSALEAMNAAALSLDALANELRNQTGKVTGDAQLMMKSADEMLKGAQQSARAVSAMADEFSRLASDNRAAVRDFGESGLYEMTQFMVDARSLVGVLKRLAEQIERDPARFLFGDQQKGVDAR